MDRIIATPSYTREIIEKNQFFFKKNFGQNFLIDANIIRRIVQAAGITKNDFVLEIGPGIGSLTQFLCASAREVAAVEIDRQLIPILKETLADEQNLTLIQSDILKLDLSALIQEKNHGQPIKVAANLPYYITTPILMALLEQQLPLSSITVMVQKEVANRMQATPGTKDYGALSVAVQYYSQPHFDFVVPPSCFMPRPAVDSAVITLYIPQQRLYPVGQPDFFFQVVKGAFAQRRKTLVNCLQHAAFLSISKDTLLAVLSGLGLPAAVRGEALSISQFAALSEALLPYRNTK